MGRDGRAALTPPRPVLSAFERNLLRRTLPAGATIRSIRYFPHYAYPCPVEVVAELRGGAEFAVALREVRHPGGSIDREAALLPALARLGLPVPALLAGPVRDRSRRGSRPVVVLSRLPGEDLQQLSLKGGRALGVAADLLVEGVRRLHALTARLARTSAGRFVPKGNLASHLETIVARGGPWMADPVFRGATERLRPVLEKIRTPLVFSNGDYQPGNFLAADGRLSGFLDFEFAWFEDPLYGFAKYPIYDIYPMIKTDVVRRFCRAAGYRTEEFRPRLALGCLAILQREIATGATHAYRARVLRLLARSL